MNLKISRGLETYVWKDNVWLWWLVAIRYFQMLSKIIFYILLQFSTGTFTINDG